MIKNLKVTESGIFWEVVCRDHWSGKDVSFAYRTNKHFEGLFLDCDLWYANQLQGTCDFQLKQKTLSGIRKALNKYFSDELGR